MNARTLLLASALLAFSLGACTSSDEGPESDTTNAVPADTALVVPAPIDTVAIDSSAMMPHDSVPGSDSATPSGTVSGSGTTGSKSGSKGSGSKNAGKPSTGNTTAPTTPSSVNSTIRGGGSSSGSGDTGHSYQSRPR